MIRFFVRLVHRDDGSMKSLRAPWSRKSKSATQLAQLLLLPLPRHHESFTRLRCGFLCDRPIGIRSVREWICDRAV